MPDKRRLAVIFQQWLCASYAYYHMNETLMPDVAYDSIAKELLEGWDKFEHRHKHLVTKSDLEAGTLYSLPEIKYPLIVKHAAIEWLKEQINGKAANQIA